MAATKATVGSVASGSTADGSLPLGHSSTDRAPGASLVRSDSLTTTTWSNRPIACRSVRRSAAASACKSAPAGPPRARA